MTLSLRAKRKTSAAQIFILFFDSRWMLWIFFFFLHWACKSEICEILVPLVPSAHDQRRRRGSLSSAADSCRNHTRFLNESLWSILSSLINGEMKEMISLWLLKWLDFRLSSATLRYVCLSISNLPPPFFFFVTTAVIWRRCRAIQGILVTHISPFKFLSHWSYFEAEGWRIKRKRKKFLETRLGKKKKERRGGGLSPSFFAALILGFKRSSHIVLLVTEHFCVFHLKNPPLAAVLYVWKRFTDSEGSSAAASYPACFVWFGFGLFFVFFPSWATGSAALRSPGCTAPCCEMWSSGSIRSWRVWVPLESRVPGERRLMTLWRPPPPPLPEAWVHTAIQTHWTCAGLCNCWPGHILSLLCFCKPIMLLLYYNAFPWKKFFSSHHLYDPIEAKRLEVCFPFSPSSLDWFSSLPAENA